MLKFHGSVVKTLLERYVKISKDLTIIDIGCGRGNDLKTLQGFFPRLVHAIDCDNNALDIAALRLKQLETDFQRRVVFSCADLTEPHFDLVVHPILKENVDLISFQCSIGYFYSSLTVLNRVIQWCASKLRPGGFIIGTCMDGKRVKSLLDTTGGSSAYYHDYYICIDKNRALTVHRLAHGNEDWPLNQDIKEKERKEKEERNVPQEYLVDMKELSSAMARNGLQEIEIKTYPLWYSEAITTSKKKPALTQVPLMSSEEQQMSFLYSSFVYRKT